MDTVDDVFSDYEKRRIGIIRALTININAFYDRCPPEGPPLSLYGLPDGSWDVRVTPEEPDDVPAPLRGINFERDGNREDWLALVAFHSDPWLLSVAFFNASRSNFNRHDRELLFSRINDLISTVFQVFNAFQNAGEELDGGSKSVPSSKGSDKGHPTASLTASTGGHMCFFWDTVEDIFANYEDRRKGIIRALTTDVDAFCNSCQPEGLPLSLYGLPDGSWDVRVPPDKPHDVHEPAPLWGINFQFHSYENRADWLALVAIHSDPWLLSVAFFRASHFFFSRHDRGLLFSRINELTTVFEAFREFYREQEDAGVDGGSKSEQSSKVQSNSILVQGLDEGPSTASSRASTSGGNESNDADNNNNV